MLFRGRSSYFLLGMAILLSSYSYSSDKITNPYVSKISISSCRKIFDNFHSVETGKLYRSKQLSSKNLDRYIKKLGLKTIINLRGENIDQNWWQMEKSVAKKNNVSFFNIAMNADRKPTKENLVKLLYLYKISKKPILIHCHSGIDRTGEAAALWVLHQKQGKKKSALKQLSLKYGYIKWIHPTKRKFIRNYKKYLNFHNCQ